MRDPGRATYGFPDEHAKDKENLRVPFDPDGSLAVILRERRKLGPLAYVFATGSGQYHRSIQIAWEEVRLRANGHAEMGRPPLEANG